jgi:hypothetical protein
MDAYLGETITIHGVSYAGDRVYLFLTGPNLPANGVALTDITKRADQGHFTIVDVDSDQTWSMKWNTARIESTIDPGTYTVYVTTDPVDLSQLGGPSSYKTLEVYLKDPGTSKVSVSTGTSYTLNPELHSSTMSPTLVFTSSTPTQTTPLPVIPVIAVPAATLLPPTKAGLTPLISVLALIGFTGLIRIIQNHRP